MERVSERGAWHLARSHRSACPKCPPSTNENGARAFKCPECGVEYLWEAEHKLVVVDVVVRLEVKVPSHWEDDNVKFWLMESSLCTGAFVAKELTKDGCGCMHIVGAMVGAPAEKKP
jgi:hypothetical protein